VVFQIFKNKSKTELKTNKSKEGLFATF